jgi:hypothetical protein
VLSHVCRFRSKPPPHRRIRAFPDRRSQLEHRPHPEQGYRACLGLLALVRRYSAERLEAACTRALAIRAPNLRSVTNILKSGMDRQPSLFPATSSVTVEHENVRGPDYYH